ncbi:hypothetical protein [Rachiplusia nu nucleopolyhedrovirus]|uniref:Uncharacterized protein n=1 Tax=Rachiplusia nu nucleopolyhedrovirus TaxID=2605775 RepID=A0AAE6M7J7_9ABAC|nr:hypothetical protein QKQ55_gp067 [Rachiplusia nu nucleopolyhedrovirus]QEI03670.1 hypothetical protein [Rachiplusia nu nucleopolyhedrovirus]
MDSSSYNFYNNDRKALKPTSLHDRNIKQADYEQITFLRRLMCRETMPSRRDDKFKVKDYNKENLNR